MIKYPLRGKVNEVKLYENDHFKHIINSSFYLIIINERNLNGGKILLKYNDDVVELPPICNVALCRNDVEYSIQENFNILVFGNICHFAQIIYLAM